MAANPLILSAAVLAACPLTRLRVLRDGLAMQIRDSEKPIGEQRFLADSRKMPVALTGKTVKHEKGVKPPEKPAAVVGVNAYVVLQTICGFKHMTMNEVFTVVDAIIKAEDEKKAA